MSSVNNITIETLNDMLTINRDMYEGLNFYSRELEDLICLMKHKAGNINSTNDMKERNKLIHYLLSDILNIKFKDVYNNSIGKRNNFLIMMKKKELEHKIIEDKANLEKT